MTKPAKIVRERDLTIYCGLKRTAINDLIFQDRFPKPIKLSKRAKGWIEDEIIEWQKARIAERDG
jgi:prophage regulatory protein